MRQGQQHRRGRGRNNNVNNHPGNRKGQNPLTRSFESNGPDVKVRGTPAHIAEKYMQLARDAQSSGDHVLAENYLQHAEHYNRIILAYREQQMQQAGEQMNGNGRHHHMPRQDFQDGDEGGSDDMMPHDDMGASDQPMMMRPGPVDQPEGQPSFGEPRQQHQPRHDQHPRFRDRQMRHDRGDRQEGGYDRGERQDRQERHGERRFDRHRERPYRSPEQPGETRDTRMHRDPGEPRDNREFREARETREHREPREHREHRPQQHEAPREIPRDPVPAAPPMEAALPAPVVEEAPAPAREGAGPRRRERFGLGADQPEFLRRPVRRPRREVEQEFSEAPPAPAAPTEEPPRE